MDTVLFRRNGKVYSVEFDDKEIVKNYLDNDTEYSIIIGNYKFKDKDYPVLLNKENINEMLNMIDILEQEEDNDRTK